LIPTIVQGIHRKKEKIGKRINTAQASFAPSEAIDNNGFFADSQEQNESIESFREIPFGHKYLREQCFSVGAGDPARAGTGESPVPTQMTPTGNQLDDYSNPTIRSWR
jgi:hypothetical protein